MNTTNEDITDSLIYGYVSKEDIIRYNKKDSFFKNFELREYDYDDIQYFDELQKGEKYYGCWEYEMSYGLGITQSILIEDDENGSTICRFKLENCTDIGLSSVYDDYPFPILEGNIHDYGDLLLQEIFIITSRKMLKEIISTKWIEFCKEALHRKIIYGHCYNLNLDKIHEFKEVEALQNKMPGPSHYELRKQYKDFYTNVIKNYPYELFCELPEQTNEQI